MRKGRNDTWGIAACLVTLVIILYIFVSEWTPSPSFRSTEANTPSDHSTPYAAETISQSVVDEVHDIQNTSERDLIVYAYHESELSRKNLEFFIAHALHDKADFLFIMNGDHAIHLPKRPNIKVVERDNSCFDLGAYHAVFSSVGADDPLYKYRRYIFMNASVRGPFFPVWARKTCWSDVYFDRLQGKTKMVGMGYYCPDKEHPSHVQSMLWATDRLGLEVIMPNLRCYGDFLDTVHNGEIKLTEYMRNAGYEVYSLMAAFDARGGGISSATYDKNCQPYLDPTEGGDPDFSNTYEGMTFNPYETL